MRKIILMAMLFCILLNGCKKEGEKPVNYVTKIEVSGAHLGQPLDRVYTDPEKMTAILTYLRRLEKKGRTVFVPEWLVDSTCRITVHTSGRESTTFLQEGAYCSEDAKTWRRISPDQAQALYALVAGMDSDPEPDENF